MWHVRGATVRGDVDGDGKAEDVAVEDQGPESCRFRVRASGENGEIVGPLELSECAVKPAETYDTDLPSVRGLAEIDKEPGLEIVVETHRGASTEFASVLTVRNDQLKRLALPPPFLDDEFAYEGSVTHLEAVDCASAGRGSIVVTGYSPEVAVHSVYRVEGTALRLVRTRGERSRQGINPIPINEPQPFPSCMKVRSG